MSRPKKPRHCGCNMKGQAYKPTGTPLNQLEHIAIEQDELEALKLSDYDGLTQAQAGKKMGISRGTVQRLLTLARKKVAKGLLEGAALILK